MKTIPSDDRETHSSCADHTLSGFAESIPVPTLFLTSEMHIRYANTAFARALGIDAKGHLHQELPAHWWTEPEEGPAQMQKLLRDATQSEADLEPVRLSMQSTKGAEVCVEVHAAPWIGGPDGAPDMLVVTFLKIDDRKNRRQALTSEWAWHDELFETSGDLVFVLDRARCLRFVNRAWQEHVGYASHDVIGTPGFDLICPEFHDLFREQLRIVYAGLHVENLLFRSKTKDGGHIDVLANLTPIFDRDDNVIEVLGAGRDITELKQIQEELKRSEERLRILFEYAPDGYYLCDLKGRFIDGNRAAERICGYQREELIGKSFLEAGLLGKRDLPKAAALLAKGALGQPTGLSELTLRRKDGTQVPIEICAYPVTIEGQTLLLGIARDITERKQAQERLQASEAKYRDLHESSRDGCAAVDLDGRVLESNAAFREMLGYTEAELSQLSYRDFTPARWHDIQARIVEEQILPRGYSDLFEKEYIRKDGTVFPVELRIYLKKDPDGVPTGMWAIVRDITRRRRAEEELRESEARFKIMTDSAQDAILMMEPHGRITFYSRTAQATFGWTAAEALGKDLHTLITPPRYHGAYHKGFAHFRATGEGPAVGKTMELTALRKDGTEFPIEISLAAVTLDGEWHAIGIVRDITERKQVHEELLREKVFSDSVINSLPGIFYMFDEDGHYAWWNKNFESVTEYSAAEIPNVHPTRLFVGADRERIAERIAQAFAEGSATVEADLVTKSGRRIPHLFTGVRAERNGKPYVIGGGIDITERRRAQFILGKLNAELESGVQELERSNGEPPDFTHIPAHDLKAPLRGISTLVDSLIEDHGEHLGSEGQEKLRLLFERVDRMGCLISGILHTPATESEDHVALDGLSHQHREAGG